MIGLAAVPAVLLLVLMLPAPESPRWLVKVDRTTRPRSNLKGAGRGGRRDELGEIEEVEEERAPGPRVRLEGARQSWVRPALIMGCGMALFTQLSGIEMIVYYTPTILTGVGFEEASALYVSVALAVTYVIMNCVGLAIVDRVGRRRLSLIMTPGAALALAVLGVVFVFGAVSAGTAPFIIACLIVFMFFTAGGLQVMGWLTGSEIYPLGVRGAGTSAQSATLWGSNVIITLTLLSTIERSGSGPPCGCTPASTCWRSCSYGGTSLRSRGAASRTSRPRWREGTFHPGGVPIRHKGEEKAAT